MGIGDKFDAAMDKLADAKARLKEDAADAHTDDTEGGASTTGRP